MTDPTLRAPTPPGPWVDETLCRGCGARYADHRCGVTFAAAAERIRVASGTRHEVGGGGWRRRRAVLWAMRVTKLEDWYLTHYGCGSEVAEVDPYGTLRDGHGLGIF